jgi:ATP-binding cassette subfamily B protein
MTAIIGGTGSGKSTLAGLIPRFYDVNHGRVLVDGVDVREMTQADLRGRIGFVPQKAVLFHGHRGRQHPLRRENASDEEVQRAAAVAQAIEFVDAMPEKFAAPISQGGINLSGGQKQRLSIARAIVRKPDVYVFDDSFSALDFTTDAKLRAALRERNRQRHRVRRRPAHQHRHQCRSHHRPRQRASGGSRHARRAARDNEIYREIVSSQVSLEEVA